MELRGSFKSAIVCAAFVLHTGQSFAQDPASLANLSVVADLAVEEVGRVSLFLEVFVNGRATNLVAEFALDPLTGIMYSPRSELVELGLKPGSKTSKMVALRSIPGLTYEYHEDRQSIDIDAPITALQPDVISAVNEQEVLDPDRSYGAVLNYNLDAIYQEHADDTTINSLSALLDGRIFSPFGILRSSGVVRFDGGADDGSDFIRLESKFQYSNAKKRLTFVAGDVQSSAPAWARSIRIGGIQLRRDFSLRNDLVTQQLLSFDGAAAVPSTVDVFIDNSRTYSTDLDAGPFRLEDLPVQGGAGDAVIVVTDANGRKTSKAVSFFVSNRLLKRNVLDFSVEAGYARQSYGFASNDYGDDAVFSSSLRFGLTERVTLEGHIETKSDLKLFGIGLTTVPFNIAEVSCAIGQSEYVSRKAAFAQCFAATQIGKVSLNGSVQVAQTGFADLATATGADFLGTGALTIDGSLLEAPTKLTTIGINMPSFDDGSFGIGYVQATRANSNDELVTASYGQQFLGGRGSFSFYGSHDLKSGDSRAGLGLSLTTGKRTYARATTTYDAKGRLSAGIGLARTISDQPGDFGYTADMQRNSLGDLSVRGRGEYLGRYGKSALEVSTYDGNSRVNAQFDGAIATAGGAFALGRTVYDSFAIVDVGAGGVPVSVHNREVARTDFTGNALVTGLSSLRRNRVAVDVNDLPASLSLNATAMDVVPNVGAGVRVTLANKSGAAAVVVLIGSDGAPVGVGSVAYLNGRSDEFFVGYGGETYFEAVEQTNTVTVQTDTGNCSASFDLPSSEEVIPVIAEVVCK